MITWHKQGAAYVGAFTLLDETKAQAVVVAGRENPRGAMLVVPGGQPGSPETWPLSRVLDRVPLANLIDIGCCQERAFGASGLPPL